MVHIEKEKDCCGCAACMAACPKNCITMKEGTLGARFPSIDKAMCVSCGMCETVCPIMNIKSDKRTEYTAYAAYSKNSDVRMRASSGGMVETFSTYLFEKNYVVYGAAFHENLTLKCTEATNQTELFPLLKSKYIQSDLSGKYQEIKEKLNAGERILFVSTPCQVYALKLYLKKQYDNLITVDFICRGVPSQRFFDACTTYDERRKKIKINSFQFRAKQRKNATLHCYSVNNGKPKLYYNSTFYRAFQKYICLRESCYDCIFSKETRYSDITVGDFHDIDRYVRGINRFDGVSLVIPNTERGRTLFQNVQDKLVVHEMDLDLLMQDGICFSEGTKRPKTRDAFVNSYQNDPFDLFVKKNLNRKSYLKFDLYYRLPLFVRKKIKSVLGI